MKLFNLIILSLATSSLHALESSVRGLAEKEYDSVGTTSVRLEGDKMDNKVKIRLTNQAYQQPFGGFFVMTHNKEETPIFKVGMSASEPLARLAEDGNPGPLLEAYNASSNAGYVIIENEGAPYFGGDSLEITVPYDINYPYLTIASMAINTNDCFVALNGVKLEPKAVFQLPGYDSGTEENNELCTSIPGPACEATTGNVASGNGEGFVHIHRGFFGVGPDLSAQGYDWRNPMMRVEMEM